MKRIMSKCWTDFTDGLWNVWSVVWYGQVYPRSLDVRRTWRP